MPLSAAWCRRPRRFSHRFQRRFYRPIRDILRGHGRRQRGLVPLPKRTDAEEASHDHPEDGPGPTDSDVPVPLSPAKSQYRPLDPARAPVFPPFSPSDSLHFHCPLRHAEECQPRRLTAGTCAARRTRPRGTTWHYVAQDRPLHVMVGGCALSSEGVCILGFRPDL